MAFAPIAIAGLSALGGALGNRAVNTTSTTTPMYDIPSLQLRNQIIQNYQNMLTQGPSNVNSYIASQTNDINRQRQLQRQKLAETLAYHGIRGPAFELALANNDNNRVEDITRLRQEAPFLASQYASQILGNAGQFFNSERVPTTTTGYQPGNVLGGGVGGGASALAYLYGQGAFGGTTRRNPAIGLTNTQGGILG